eukprot:9503883-Pyramimonas_sp.AAC.1
MSSPLCVSVSSGIIPSATPSHSRNMSSGGTLPRTMADRILSLSPPRYEQMTGTRSWYTSAKNTTGTVFGAWGDERAGRVVNPLERVYCTTEHIRNILHPLSLMERLIGSGKRTFRSSYQAPVGVAQVGRVDELGAVDGGVTESGQEGEGHDAVGQVRRLGAAREEHDAQRRAEQARAQLGRAPRHLLEDLAALEADNTRTVSDQSDEGRGYIPTGRTNQTRGEGIYCRLPVSGQHTQNYI